MTERPELYRKRQNVQAHLFTDRPKPQYGLVHSVGKLVSLRETLRSMKPDQSFIVDDEKGRKAALVTAREMKIRVTTQKQEDGSFLVWRL